VNAAMFEANDGRPTDPMSAGSGKQTLNSLSQPFSEMTHSDFRRRALRLRMRLLGMIVNHWEWAVRWEIPYLHGCAHPDGDPSQPGRAHESTRLLSTGGALV
jgi:hypothetical protein